MQQVLVLEKICLNNKVNCPKCGKLVPTGKMQAELTSVEVNEHKVNLSVRRFTATCPNCGKFNHDRVGHHSTLSDKEMDKLFPKAIRRRVKGALSPFERISFSLTLRGFRMPKDSDIERWLAIQEQLLKSGRN